METNTPGRKLTAELEKVSELVYINGVEFSVVIFNDALRIAQEYAEQEKKEQPVNESAREYLLINQKRFHATKSEDPESTFFTFDKVVKMLEEYRNLPKKEPVEYEGPDIAPCEECGTGMSENYLKHNKEKGLWLCHDCFAKPKQREPDGYYCDDKIHHPKECSDFIKKNGKAFYFSPPPVREVGDEEIEECISQIDAIAYGANPKYGLPIGAGKPLSDMVSVIRKLLTGK